jgi:adenosine kinase
MAALICGSLAFDTIMTFEGRFAEQILPDQLHILNVSFLVPSLRRDFGGCAGNIAYSLQVAGRRALPMATLGNDGASTCSACKALGISDRYVKQVDDTYTAQAMIMTDRDNNQITAFHPGAMMQAHITRRIPRRYRWASSRPTGAMPCWSTPQQFACGRHSLSCSIRARAAHVQRRELLQFVEQATWVTVNDYEGKMLCERTGLSLADMSRKVQGPGGDAGRQGL